MDNSFFKTTPFKIIEREIVINDYSIEDKEDVIKVYDFSAWKVNNHKENMSNNLLFTQKKMLQVFQQKHLNPFGICITTAKEVEIAAKYAKFLYIPGEFCRQSDVLEAAKNSKIPFIVEKGIFLSPNDIKRLCEKIEGSDFCLVECGSSNGYSDVILDPRSLYLMQKNSPCFGVSLSDLYASEGANYAHKPAWLKNEEFIQSFISVGKVFGAQFFVIKNYGQGRIATNLLVYIYSISGLF